jgi:tRNA (guanine-N7-)-methyltransferase
LGRNKPTRWAELETLDRVIQPQFEDFYGNDHPIKGNWKRDFFCNNNPIVLELGCGRGEYTVNLAGKFPDRNFIGVDIKGARLWRGAKTANEQKLFNAGFLRTRIEIIRSFFDAGEVDEIWITFPDPQIKTRRNKKRLTSPIFLNYYHTFLKNDGIIHLKTDNHDLYKDTLAIVQHNSLEIITSTDDLYSDNMISGPVSELLSIKTHYEQQFLEKGMKINYLSFKLDRIIQNPHDTWQD